MKKSLIVALSFIFITIAHADVKMPAIFGDHMVLQQDIKIPVWGWADPGEDVTVTFAGKSAKVKADPKGDWRINLDKVSTNTTAQTLTIQGKNKVEFTDVLVGDVWLCTGQSNMEWRMAAVHNADTEIPKANDPMIRLFLVKIAATLQPLKDVEGKWEVCSPETVKTFSGVGYFFAKELRARYGNKPFGLIGTYMGGTSAQAWTSVDAIQKYADKDEEFKTWLDNRTKLLANYEKATAEYPALKEKFDKDFKEWNEQVQKNPEYKAKLEAWREEAQKLSAEGKPTPPQPKLPKPKPILDNPDGGKHIVGNLFNAMIHPLIPYAIKGAIWYQGEGNAGNGAQYKYLFPLMISDWREKWKQGDFPFLYVQLAAHGAITTEPYQKGTGWPSLREAQAETLKVNNTGMAVAIDVGNPIEIHPKNKEIIGQRLSLIARKVAYGENLVCSGPMYNSMKIEGNKIRITFKNLGGGLKTGVTPWTPSGKLPPLVAEPQSFSIAGEDKKFVWANAKIEGNEVVVWSDAVPNPVAARYAWIQTPSPYANLYNKENLPAVPFRTDTWE